MAVLLILLFPAGLIYYARRVEPYRLKINRQTLYLRHWRAEHDGLKVLLISDLHQRGRERDFDFLEKIVEAADAENADLVFHLGDYITDTREKVAPEDIAEALSRIRCKLGSFAVMGNHDWAYGGDQVKRAFDQYKIPMLENSFRSVVCNGRKIYVLGLPDKQSRSRVLRTGKPSYPVGDPPSVLVLSHSPDYFLEFRKPYALMMSGHTHGGQIVLPVFGPLGLRSDYGEALTAGRADNGDQQLFITSGIGMSVLLARFRCPPEIVVLTLRRRDFR